MSRVHVVVLFSLLALLTVSSFASAQVNPTLAIAPKATALAIGPGATGTITWTVRNTATSASSTADGTVTLTPPAVPTGWKITLDKPTFALARGASQDVVGTITAPSAGSPAPQNGNVVLAGQIQNGVPGQAASTASSAPVALSFNAPPPPAVVPAPPKDYTVLIVTLGLLCLALAGAGVYWFYFASGVALVAEQATQPLNVGVDGVYKVRVENKLNRARIVELRVRELPRTWFAAFSFPFVRLQGKESIVVPLYVKVPFTTSAGAIGALLAQGRPQGPFPWRAQVRVIANVIDVEIGSTYRPAAAAAPADGASSTRVETTVPVDAPGVVVPLARWGALDDFTVKALAAVDVRDTEDLLHADPARLAKDTGIAESHLRHLMAVADLVRVRGIDAKDAEALVRSGIRTLRDLVQETPESLLAKVHAHFETIGEPQDARKVTAKATKRWIEAARDLESTSL